MSLETVSNKRNRVYPRKFDHDECKRLRAEDPKRWTYEELAAHFDVSYGAIVRVLNEDYRRKLDRHSLEYMRRRRRPCLHPGCETLVWTHQPDRSGLCNVHSAARFGADNVRPTELRCLRCLEWKPDSEFGKGKSKVRRNHRTHCRSCATIIRREFRHAHPEQENASAAKYYRDVKRERKPMASFVVLEEQENGNGIVYRIIDTVEASSGDHAIEKIVKESGRFVAVPATRFEVVPVAPQQTLRVIRS